jgi:hypothetical protein
LRTECRGDYREYEWGSKQRTGEITEQGTLTECWLENYAEKWHTENQDMAG